jgi:response regulator RpfG family c-di-GMP phosphodiesterase
MENGSCLMCDLSSELAHSDSADIRYKANALVNHVISHLKVDAADVLICEPPANAFKYAGGRGFNSRAFELSGLHGTLAGQVAREYHTIHQPDLRKLYGDSIHLRELSNEGFISYIGTPLVANDQLKGVLEIFHRDRLNVNSQWQRYLEGVAERGANAIGQAMLARQLKRSNNELVAMYDATLESWALALELRDCEPKGHIKRVTETTVEFARLMGVSEADLIHVRRGAILHDIGKMAIPDSVLFKKESLEEAEWEIIRRHPTIAYEQLMAIELLRPALDIPYCHHEKWDGTGYPRGLAGEQIPFAARIFAIIDVWDTLNSNRPYRNGWPLEKISQHLRDQGGKHFDQKLADTFVKMLDNELKFKRTGRDPALLRGTYEETIVKV